MFGINKRLTQGLKGYYEVRDPRGGALANFLQYAGNPLTGLQSVNHVWGQSRWGIFHYRLPPVSSALLDCSTVPPNEGLFNSGNGSGASSRWGWLTARADLQI